MSTWIGSPVANRDYRDPADLHLTWCYMTDENLEGDRLHLAELVVDKTKNQCKLTDKIYADIIYKDVWGNDSNPIYVDRLQVTTNVYRFQRKLIENLAYYNLPVSSTYPIWTPHVTIEGLFKSRESNEMDKHYEFDEIKVYVGRD